MDSAPPRLLSWHFEQAEIIYEMFRQGRMSEKGFLTNAERIKQDCPIAAEYLLYLLEYTQLSRGAFE